MAQMYVKRCSTSVIIREMKLKITVRDRLIPARMAIILLFVKCWQRCGDIQTLIYCWWECKMLLIKR